MGNGQITFTKAFAVGICITLISCLLCLAVGSSLLQLHARFHGQKYGIYMVEKLKASGESPTAIQEQLQQAQKYKQ
jgi:hypothetical protein